jgi:hypothetical protein
MPREAGVMSAQGCIVYAIDIAMEGELQTMPWWVVYGFGGDDDHSCQW